MTLMRPLDVSSNSHEVQGIEEKLNDTTRTQWDECRTWDVLKGSQRGLIKMWMAL